MDLRLIEVFCRVYETRSYSRAAEMLRLKQPTISVHMRTLESQVHAPLFEMHGRALVPTRAATQLYAHGRRILAARQDAIDDLDRLLNRYAGELEIGGSTIPGEYMLPAIAASFRSRHPEVSVRIRVADTDRTVAALEAGDIELAFVGAKRPSRDLQYRHFADDELVLVGRPDVVGDRRTIGTRDLAALPFVLREPGSGTRAVMEAHLAKCGITTAGLRVVTEIGSSNGARLAALAGLGVAALSRRAVEGELASGDLVALRMRECREMRREFFVVTTRKRKLSLVASAFLDVARRGSS